MGAIWDSCWSILEQLAPLGAIRDSCWIILEQLALLGSIWDQCWDLLERRPFGRVLDPFDEGGCLPPPLGPRPPCGSRRRSATKTMLIAFWQRRLPKGFGRAPERFPKGFRKVSERFLDGSRKVSERSPKDSRKMPERFQTPRSLSGKEQMLQIRSFQYCALSRKVSGVRKRSGTFRKPFGNLSGTVRKTVGNLSGTFRDPRSLSGALPKPFGNLLGTFP